MLPHFTLRPWRTAVFICLIALNYRPAAAQLLAPTVSDQKYDFMAFMLVEGGSKNFSKLLFSPAFGGRTETQLAATNAFLPANRLEELRRNGEVVANTLSELSAAGWELIQVSPTPPLIDKDVLITRYLLRKPRP